MKEPTLQDLYDAYNTADDECRQHNHNEYMKNNDRPFSEYARWGLNEGLWAVFNLGKKYGSEGVIRT